MTTPASSSFVLDSSENGRLANLAGQFDEHIRLIERRLGVEVRQRGNEFTLVGSPRSIDLGEQIISNLYSLTARKSIGTVDVHLQLQESELETLAADGEIKDVSIRTKRATVLARGANQRAYIENIREHDISFGVGPAGTGKTYLAVACAVAALDEERVNRLCLVRPAVEAGERLGFLPGDMAQKVDPYLRPLYDALYEMLGFERVAKLIERNVIEVAPLAFMRGRTLNGSFIILDEAQNTTVEQMKMFLTRIGFGSKAVITGDITQVDLPRGKTSGLRHAVDIVQQIDGISFTFFRTADVVRHSLVGRILDAYEEHENDPRNLE
ncbi:MAG: phosphate starvation-inducible PhoH-like protein [Gammaproteobacteria bacterium]